MTDLTGRAAIVTGSTKGVGLAIAKALAAAGASVVVSSRTAKAVAAVVADLDADATGEVMGVVADVGNPMECERLVAEAVARLGRLDILINNAGLGVMKPMTEMRFEEWRAQIDVNLAGPWMCTKAALPHLTEAGQRPGGGWVIQIGSLASRYAMDGGTGYNASKFGLLGMSEAMMLDLRQLGIRVSMVMPGSINTEFNGKTMQPTRDWKLEADDCAAAVLHLLSYPRNAHPSRIELRPSRPPVR